MLSGVGDKEELSSLGIESVLDMPQVGRGLEGGHDLALWTLLEGFPLTTSAPIRSRLCFGDVA